MGPRGRAKRRAAAAEGVSPALWAAKVPSMVQDNVCGSSYKAASHGCHQTRRAGQPLISACCDKLCAPLNLLTCSRRFLTEQAYLTLAQGQQGEAEGQHRGGPEGFAVRAGQSACGSVQSEWYRWRVCAGPPAHFQLPPAIGADSGAQGGASAGGAEAAAESWDGGASIAAAGAACSVDSASARRTGLAQAVTGREGTIAVLRAGAADAKLHYHASTTMWLSNVAWLLC